MKHTTSVALVGTVLLVMAAFTVHGQLDKYRAGKDYLLLPERTDEEDANQSQDTEDSDIEVIEFFSYSCIYCYRFERSIKNWLRKKEDGVVFSREHILLQMDHIPLARAYYVAEELEVLPKIHNGLFRAIHEHGMDLRREELLKRLFKSEAGVDYETFDEKYWSTETKEKIQDAAKKARDWRVNRTPQLVVGGKYLITAKTAGGKPEKMFKIVDFLTEKIRSEQNKDSAISAVPSSPKS